MRRLIVGRLIAAMLIVLGSASVGMGEEVLREISWRELKEEGKLAVGQLETGQPPAPVEQLKIENPDDAPRTFALLVIDDPGISEAQYAVMGRVRCEDVKGQGYLEMWNHFADGSQFFSRTLAQSGLLQSLEGSCPWRPFSLPFFAAPRTDRPTSLVVNVVLPSRGTVYLSPLRLAQYADGEDPLAVAGQWWSDRTGGLIGGILGAILGCIGGLIGILAGMGKARRLVLGLMGATCVFGLVSLAIGLVALLLHQPYGVSYPLVLVGVLCTVIMGTQLRTVRRRYERLELRRMTAIDAALSSTGPH
jgi:hypothetical protein